MFQPREELQRYCCVRVCVCLCVRSIKDSDVFIEVNLFPLTVKSHSYGDVMKLLNSSEV